MKNQVDLLKDGIKFECQGSGKCCTSHGEFGYVFLTLKDRQQIAKFLNISTTRFTKTYCTLFKGFWHLKEDPKNPDCLFLSKKKCSIYSARPTQCRTWPFWPEVMNPKAWTKEVVQFCPGVGKGKLIPKEKIAETLSIQVQSENELKSEALKNQS